MDVKTPFQACSFKPIQEGNVRRTAHKVMKLIRLFQKAQRLHHCQQRRDANAAGQQHMRQALWREWKVVVGGTQQDGIALPQRVHVRGPAAR